jgi:hypothetical protein
MESHSQSSSEPPPLYTIANLLGTFIAILTLTSPVLLIRHFSPSPPVISRENSPIDRAVTVQPVAVPPIAVVKPR